MFPSKHSLVRYEIVIHHNAFVNWFLSKYSLVKKKKKKMFYTSQSIRLHNTWLRSRELTTARLTRPCPARFDLQMYQSVTRAVTSRHRATWLQLDRIPRHHHPLYQGSRPEFSQTPTGSQWASCQSRVNHPSSLSMWQIIINACYHTMHAIIQSPWTVTQLDHWTQSRPAYQSDK